MVTDNAIMNIKEVKHCEAEDAWALGEIIDKIPSKNNFKRVIFYFNHSFF